MASTQFLHVVSSAFADIFRIAWITLLALGFLLYLAHIHRKLGKELIGSGIVMMLLVQFVFPFLNTL